MPPIDPRFRLRTQLPRPRNRIRKPFRGPPNGERFLQGPIPLNWLSVAARLPGKVAACRHRALVRGRAPQFGCRSRFAISTGQRFGLDRNAKYRALRWLEGAGLITVERKLGRAPIVTINGCPADREA